MPSNFSLRPYEKGDEKGIVKLLTLTWGKWPNYDISCSPEKHWNWKYVEKPYPTKHGIFVGESDGDRDHRTI